MIKRLNLYHAYLMGLLIRGEKIDYLNNRQKRFLLHLILSIKIRHLLKRRGYLYKIGNYQEYKEIDFYIKGFNFQIAHIGNTRNADFQRYFSIYKGKLERDLSHLEKELNYQEQNTYAQYYDAASNA